MKRGTMGMAICALLATVSLLATPVLAAEEAAPLQATVRIDASQVQRTMDPRMLGGSNVAAWMPAHYHSSPVLRQRMSELSPGIMRLPGGSWGDGIFWNGNGMRDASGQVDPTRVGPDGYPAIDYSAYAPSILVDNQGKINTNGWHGNVDVKTLHEFIQALPNCEQLVIANVGTGRPIDAAEWVKWANQKMGYNVRYWEMGNELDGSWEAGHFLPDGKPMTPEIYAQRFKEFAKALKAVDPTVKIGGAASSTDEGGFAEVMLRDAGEYVDFVSVHLYPGNPMYNDTEQFARVKVASECAQRVKGWIRKYQPQRADQIELAITEWGLPDYRGNVEQLGTLWTALFVRESALAGYHFNTHWYWDTYIEPAGENTNGARPEGPWQTRSTYWGLWMWNHYTGPQLLQATQEGAQQQVYTLATRSDEAVYVMVINTDREQEAKLSLALGGFDAAAQGEHATISSREYFRNYLTQKVQWSTGPRIDTIATGGSFDVTVPPFSVSCVRVPSQAKPQLSELALAAQAAKKDAGQPELRVIAPAEVYVGDAAECYVVAMSAGTELPYTGPALPAAQVQAGGDAKLDRDQVRLSEAVGRFFVTPNAAGEITISAASGELKASTKLVAKPAVPQPRVVWEFELPALNREDGYISDWPLSPDTSIRANQRVARIDLPADGIVTDQEHRTLLRLDKYPPEDKLKKANIRGVLFDAQLGRDFVCDDPDASIIVVMQSPADYWMYLGKIPLAQVKDWKTHTLELTQAKHIEAVPFAFNVWLMLDAKQPAKGSIYIDRVGFMVR